MISTDLKVITLSLTKTPLVDSSALNMVQGHCKFYCVLVVRCGVV